MRYLLMVVTICLSLSSINCIAAETYITEKIFLQQDSVLIGLVSDATLVDITQKNNYTIKNLFDKNLDTAWVTKYEESFAYRDNGLFKLVFKQPVYVKSLTITNGCQKSSKLFYANQRMKDLMIEKVLVGGRSLPLQNTIKIDDRIGSQEISLIDGWTDAVNFFMVKEIIFNVLDIYKGTKYQDLCISEMTINYAKGINYTPSLLSNDLFKLIEKNKNKINETRWDWAGLYDNNYKLFNDLLYYAVIGNKDALKYFETYTPEGVGQSEAMINIYKNSLKENRGVILR